MATDGMSARQDDAASLHAGATDALGVLSDEALMERISVGDEPAYQVLVQRQLGRSLGFATRVLGNAADAEEVMQEAFVRVWRSAPNWEQGGAKFSTWFYRVVMNLCIDRQRKTKGKQVSLDEAGDPADDRANADETVHGQQVGAQLQDALQTLPERQRAALSLCYLQGLSNKEAAEMLDVNIKALEMPVVPGSAVTEITTQKHERRPDGVCDMTLEEFKQLLDLHGSDRNRWPEERRSDAEAVLEASPEAQAACADAVELDQLFNETAELAPSAALMANVMAVPGTVPQERLTRESRARKTSSAAKSGGLSLRFLFPRLAGVAASAALIGFVMGTTNIVPTDGVFEMASVETETVDLSDFIFGDEDDEVIL